MSAVGRDCEEQKGLRELFGPTRLSSKKLGVASQAQLPLVWAHSSQVRDVAGKQSSPEKHLSFVCTSASQALKEHVLAIAGVSF